MQILRRESWKRGHTKTQPSLGGCWFYTRILIQSCWYVHESQAKTSGRGPPGSTINILKEIIRFNNNNHLTHGPPRFLPTRGSSRRGVLPPLRGGNSNVKSLLFSPYPAIPPYVVRTPHPGMTDDPAHQIWRRAAEGHREAITSLLIWSLASFTFSGGRAGGTKLHKAWSSFTAVQQRWETGLGFIKLSKVC